MIGFKLVLVRLIPLQYRILPSKCPLVLEIHGPKGGVDAYTEKPFVYGDSPKSLPIKNKRLAFMCEP